MKLAIVGSRSFRDEALLCSKLDALRDEFPIREIISGGAVGADSLGLMYARDNGIYAKVFLPEWEKGKQAGFDRNTLIAEAADVVLAFWDGKSNGTADTIAKARALKKTVIVVHFEPTP
jgi:hypothetical protein